MRAVVHQDRQAELARGDDADRKNNVSGFGHHATSAIEPSINAQACTIIAAPFQVERSRTAIS